MRPNEKTVGKRKSAATAWLAPLGYATCYESPIQSIHDRMQPIQVAKFQTMPKAISPAIRNRVDLRIAATHNRMAGTQRKPRLTRIVVPPCMNMASQGSMMLPCSTWNSLVPLYIHPDMTSVHKERSIAYIATSAMLMIFISFSITSRHTHTYARLTHSLQKQDV